MVPPKFKEIFISSSLQSISQSPVFLSQKLSELKLRNITLSYNLFQRIKTALYMVLISYFITVIAIIFTLLSICTIMRFVNLFLVFFCAFNRISLFFHIILKNNLCVPFLIYQIRDMSHKKIYYVNFNLYIKYFLIYK